MCRLILASCNAVRSYDKKYGLLSLFQELERSMGGHGNGIALFDDKGRAIAYNRGVKFSVHSCYNVVQHTRDFSFMIFHTRIASVSSIGDRNCHPYLTHGGDALAMNGTLYDLGPVAREVDKTDSELAFRLVRGTDMDETVKILSSLDAIFVGACKGKPYAVKTFGDLQEWTDSKLSGSDFFFASQFPKSVLAVHNLPYGFTFKNGERGLLDIKQSDRWGYAFHSGLYHYWDDDAGSVGDIIKLDSKPKSSSKTATATVSTTTTNTANSSKDAHASKQNKDYYAGFDEGYDAGYADGTLDNNETQYRQGFIEGYKCSYWDCAGGAPDLDIINRDVLDTAKMH